MILDPETIAVLSTYPGERVRGFYESGLLDREDPDYIVRDLAQALGHPRDGTYADSLVERHRSMRYEFQTGNPF